jgi:hypothetical protein
LSLPLSALVHLHHQIIPNGTCTDAKVSTWLSLCLLEADPTNSEEMSELLAKQEESEGRSRALEAQAQAQAQAEAEAEAAAAEAAAEAESKKKIEANKALKIGKTAKKQGGSSDGSNGGEVSHEDGGSASPHGGSATRLTTTTTMSTPSLTTSISSLIPSTASPRRWLSKLKAVGTPLIPKGFKLQTLEQAEDTEAVAKEEAQRNALMQYYGQAFWDIGEGQVGHGGAQ